MDEYEFVVKEKYTFMSAGIHQELYWGVSSRYSDRCVVLLRYLCNAALLEGPVLGRTVVISLSLPILS